MKLSERGAIRSAIADGGFHVYPAGRLIEMITAELSGDKLTDDFSPMATVEKISRVNGPADPIAGEIFREDLKLLCDRLSKMAPEYDIESVFEKIKVEIPAMAKRYYGIDDFEPVHPKVLEFYFEGYNDMYMNADWSAFNVNSSEAIELSVPVGTYFKRNQVSPGMPEYVTMHEANHAMQEKVALPNGVHHYVPWMDEGMADAFGRIMLFRATKNEALLTKVKNFRTEIDVTDPRKVTYHYGEETALLVLLRGRLPFVKALMRARQKDPMSIDWNAFAVFVKQGLDPHVAVAKAFKGTNVEAFRNKIERDEKSFRNESDLDQMDLRVIGMFLATTPPATLPAKEYKAALWIAREAAIQPNTHYLDPSVVPASVLEKLNMENKENAIECSKISQGVWEKHPIMALKVLISEDSIPVDLKEEMESLSNSYFIVKRKIGDKVFFEPYGGGLPYRLGTGEIRCRY